MPRYIQFRVTQKAIRITFKLYTTASRLVRTAQVKDELKAGMNTIMLPAQVFKGLGAGTYYYVIICKNEKGEETRSKIYIMIISK